VIITSYSLNLIHLFASAPQPQNSLSCLVHWLRLLRARVSEALEELQKRGDAATADRLVVAAKERYARDHPDGYVLSHLRLRRGPT
jgi:hypothetical protein